MLFLLKVNLQEIYRKSVRIALKNKALWVIGMALVAFSGGGFNFSQSFSNLDDLGDFTSDPSKLSESVNGSLEPLLNYLKNLFSSIPTHIWILLLTAIFLAIIIGFIFSLVARNWARGSLIGGINDAYEEQPVNLKSSSEHGLRNLKSLVWLSVVPWLLYTLILLAFGALILLLTAVAAPLAIVLGLLAGIFAVVAYLAISATQIWAVRVAVIEGTPAKDAFLEGWRMVQKHLLKMLTLGCLNTLISCCVGCVVMSALLPGIAVVIGLFAVSPTLGLAMLVPIIFVALPLLFLSLLFNGIYRVFNYSTWNLLYRQVREEGSRGEESDGQPIIKQQLQ